MDSPAATTAAMSTAGKYYDPAAVYGTDRWQVMAGTSLAGQLLLNLTEQ
jgi:predicted RNA-binding protein with PUA-like domain